MLKVMVSIAIPVCQGSSVINEITWVSMEKWDNPAVRESSDRKHEWACEVCHCMFSLYAYNNVVLAS